MECHATDSRPLLKLWARLVSSSSVSTSPLCTTEKQSLFTSFVRYSPYWRPEAVLVSLEPSLFTPPLSVPCLDQEPPTEQDRPYSSDPLSSCQQTQPLFSHAGRGMDSLFPPTASPLFLLSGTVCFLGKYLRWWRALPSSPLVGFRPLPPAIAN